MRNGTFVEPSHRTVARFLVEEWLPAMRLTPAQLTAFYGGLLEAGQRHAQG
jgi:hypothetical protein